MPRLIQSHPSTPPKNLLIPIPILIFIQTRTMRAGEMLFISSAFPHCSVLFCSAFFALGSRSRFVFLLAFDPRSLVSLPSLLILLLFHCPAPCCISSPLFSSPLFWPPPHVYNSPAAAFVNIACFSASSTFNLTVVT